MRRFALLLLLVLLISAPAAAQDLYPKQLAAVQQVFVKPLLSFGDDAARCLPDQQVVKDEIELVLRRSGIAVVQNQGTPLAAVMRELVALPKDGSRASVGRVLLLGRPPPRRRPSYKCRHGRHHLRGCLQHQPRTG